MPRRLAFIASSLLAGCLAAAVSAATPDRFWLPYAADHRAICMQGPRSNFTHKDIYAWDFGLAEGSPVVAAAPGRVIRVIDDLAKSGFNSFAESNQIFIDHGDGSYSTYLHHKTGTASVRPGQVVAAGTRLAQVGNVGTFKPHIHFDLRGPSWHQTHDVVFSTAMGRETIVPKEIYTSATPAAGPPPADFRDSLLDGDEFTVNGVRLVPGKPAFRMAAGQAVVYDGSVLAPAREVMFYLWEEGKPSEYWSGAVPDAQGRFRLAVNVPGASKGPRWYRITIREPGGKLRDTATLPVLVE
jgi:murein DD-endopeptidase MepM/ murein hydrolase activator NlpD